MWFGWSGRISSGAASSRPNLVEQGGITYATLDLTPATARATTTASPTARCGRSSITGSHLTDYNRKDCATYLSVNRWFAEKLAPLLRPDDILWVNDYHLIPLGEALRSSGLGHRMGFFLHTPFPRRRVLTALPNHAQLDAPADAPMT